MYNAAGQQVPIPANGYRTIGYAVTTAGAATSAIALNGTESIKSTTGGSIYLFNDSNGQSISIGNAVQTDLGFDPISGMSWGRWQGGYVSGSPSGTVQASVTSNLHWFALPIQSQSITLPVTGQFAYTYAGGTTPTDNYGTQGTITTSTLNSDFSAQQVSASIGVSMPASTGAAAVQINATANNMPILPGANFKSTSPVVTCTGCVASPTGVINGQFSQGGVGAGVGYGLQNGQQAINGAAVFHK